ncbi:MAG: hypothetical protein MUE44_05615 [Oscillatoriaceae cyanobacterium Prado104]|nr:hypothetical protein [Oscillatoriaceae cyanobacterium Prado104]
MRNLCFDLTNNFSDCNQPIVLIELFLESAVSNIWAIAIPITPKDRYQKLLNNSFDGLSNYYLLANL